MGLMKWLFGENPKKELKNKIYLLNYKLEEKYSESNSGYICWYDEGRLCLYLRLWQKGSCVGKEFPFVDFDELESYCNTHIFIDEIRNEKLNKLGI